MQFLTLVEEAEETETEEEIDRLYSCLDKDSSSSSPSDEGGKGSKGDDKDDKDDKGSKKKKKECSLFSYVGEHCFQLVSFVKSETCRTRRKKTRSRTGLRKRRRRKKLRRRMKMVRRKKLKQMIPNHWRRKAKRRINLLSNFVSLISCHKHQLVHDVYNICGGCD